MGEGPKEEEASLSLPCTVWLGHHLFRVSQTRYAIPKARGTILPARGTRILLAQCQDLLAQ